jgi:prepilin-type N-terminal cleavage/methylation domain-containing protein
VGPAPDDEDHEDHAMTTTRNRRGFTLTELLVAMALSILIMWILAESFKMGLEFSGRMRSTGALNDQLVGVRAVLARDLFAEHFLPDENKPGRGVHLSDQRLDLIRNTGPQVWTPPTGGFFRIVSPFSTLVTTDSDGFAVTTATNHALHFTSVLSPSEKNLYTANVSVGGPPPTPTVFSSRAAEIAYFLVDSGLRTSPGPSGQPLYYLVRRQRLCAVNDDERSQLAAAIAGDPNRDVIAHNGTTVFTLGDLTNPANRLAVSPSTPLPAPVGSPLMLSGARLGEDIVMANVLSFEVQVNWGPNTGSPAAGDEVPGSTSGPRTPPTNWDHPFDNLQVNPGRNAGYLNQGVFDTWHAVAGWDSFALTNSNTVLPLAVRVKQIKIIVRVFDAKTKQARQATFECSM